MTFTKEELITFNEMMLGRGVPNSDDGIGYNKADYGVCATYFNGLSDAQYTDLAKRLTKYCNTQLGVCKEAMQETFEELNKVSKGADRNNGISLEIREDGVIISFRYNIGYIDVVKRQPKRRFDMDTKNWIIPKEGIFKALKDLELIGADVKNALQYAKSKGLSEKVKTLHNVLVVTSEDMSFLKFDYNNVIVEEIKKIDKSKRKWNVDKKYWIIDSDCLDNLKESLIDVAKFVHI